MFIWTYMFIWNTRVGKTFTGGQNQMWPQKLSLKFKNAQFLMALIRKVLQGIKKFFEYAHWDIKIY